MLKIPFYFLSKQNLSLYSNGSSSTIDTRSWLRYFQITHLSGGLAFQKTYEAARLLHCRCIYYVKRMYHHAEWNNEKMYKMANALIRVLQYLLY